MAEEAGAKSIDPVRGPSSAQMVAAEQAAWRGVRAARVDQEPAERAVQRTLDKFVDRWLLGSAPLNPTAWCFQVAKHEAWRAAKDAGRRMGSPKSIPEPAWFGKFVGAVFRALTPAMRDAVSAYIVAGSVHRTAKHLSRDRSGVRRLLQDSAARLAMLQKLSPPLYEVKTQENPKHVAPELRAPR